MLIVGAGAAGMAAAITAARRGVRVTLLERNDEPGKKIRVSGNGRCNIGNRHIRPERYHSGDREFVRKVLEGYDAPKIEAFLRSLGLELEEEGGKLFPMGRQAASVVRLLTRECQRLGVMLVTGCQVTGIVHENGRFLVESGQRSFEAARLLLASGSPAAPQLGGSNGGMLFAQGLGHTLVPPRPALTALECDAPWTKRVAGVKLRARLTLTANGTAVAEREGDLLFADYGVSGLAVLDLSREASLRLAEWESCELLVDLFPQYGKERLTKLLTERIDPARELPIGLWLEGVLHRKLVPVVLERAGNLPSTERQLNRKTIRRLVYTLKRLSLPVTAVREFRYAEVAAGGVGVGGVDPVTMESKLLPGLFFAGEILDVDGDRGGFNFHWAWATGMRAGLSVGHI